MVLEFRMVWLVLEKLPS